jgi:hypothetical protein
LRISLTATPGAAMRRLLALVTATQAIRLKQLNPLSYVWREEPYLIEFHAAGADQCDEMKPAMGAVEKELNTRILKWDVWSDPAAYKLMQFLDKGPDGRSKCGGLPFFYNRKTGKIVCGATTEKNLMNWAQGLKHEMVLSPPPSAEQKRVQQRVTGREARIARQAFERKKKLVEEMQAKKRARGTVPAAAAPTRAAPKEAAAAEA